MPQYFRQKEVSEFNSDALAGMPPYSSAAPIAPAMESISVTKWPQNRASWRDGNGIDISAAYPKFKMNLYNHLQQRGDVVIDLRDVFILLTV